ncbi:hypothetical protein, partial [Sporolactobacillus shoreae]|uniref:hypothetical protein n=1 Tax=Sporolactobacillus shoreae TaxID=1465501 RepID=UPI0019D6697E
DSILTEMMGSGSFSMKKMKETGEIESRCFSGGGWPAPSRKTEPPAHFLIFRSPYLHKYTDLTRSSAQGSPE